MNFLISIQFLNEIKTISFLHRVNEIRYQYDTDKTLTQIRFVSEDNNVIGAINWFAVHPTSMNNTNHFVSSDNVGYAAILLEQQMNPNNLPGRVCIYLATVIDSFFALLIVGLFPSFRGNLLEHLHLLIWETFRPTLWDRSVHCPAKSVTSLHHHVLQNMVNASLLVQEKIISKAREL